jgi:glutaredoxin
LSLFKNLRSSKNKFRWIIKIHKKWRGYGRYSMGFRVFNIVSKLDFFSKIYNKKFCFAKRNRSTILGFYIISLSCLSFCVKVRRVIKKYNLSLRLVDPRNCNTEMQDLMKGGGKLKVPCLRIQNNKEGTIWMYESSSIISFLESQIPEAQEINNAK